MTNRVIEAIERHNMLKAGDTVLIYCKHVQNENV